MAILAVLANLVSCLANIQHLVPQVGLVIDLTNSYRYYDPGDFMKEGAQYIKVNRLELILYQSFLSNPFSKADRHAANTLYLLHVRLLLTYNVSQRLTLPLPQSEIAADWILHPTYSDDSNNGGVPRQLSNWQSVVGCSSAWDLDMCLMRQIQCRGRGETPDAEAVNHFCFEVLKFKTEQQQMLQDAVGPIQPKHIVVHCTHGFNRTGRPSPFGSSCDSTVAKSRIVYLQPFQTPRQHWLVYACAIRR